jgi:hypothetical protein
MGVTSVRLQHILEDHGFQARQDKSYFLQAQDPQQQVLSLIYQTLASPDYPTHGLLQDLDGAYPVWRVFPKEVGYVRDPATRTWTGTRIVKVVLSSRRGGKVISAYPVRDF